MQRPADPREFGRLVSALREPGRYPSGASGPPARVDLLETHISCVLLAGDYAYKIKKPVNLGFLDFTTLAARRFCCEEELRLNRRTAPSLYLDVVPITGSASDPVLGGDGPPIEYAVRMRRFPQDALLDRMARGGTLQEASLDDLGVRVAQFHQGLQPAGADRPFASPAQVLAAAMQNFDQIQSLAGPGTDAAALAALRDWTAREHAALEAVFGARKREGYVRECHGDLHLGNIVMLDGAPVPFDGIEFNAEFRWIDVMNEVAFLVMDLEEHRLPGLAFRFLNRYLETGGDYAGVAVLRFYIVYRALVRAKVACIRGHQPGLDAGAQEFAAAEYAHYLGFAQGIAARGRGALILMHGVSGSGKTTIARQLAAALQAVHLRSDVERKRLHGLEAGARTRSGPAAGIYSPADTERTYARLASLAREVMAAGYPVIVDAAFLDAGRRSSFRALAREAGAPFAIVSCEAPDTVLRERVARREAQGADASEAGLAILGRQLAERKPFTPDESAEVVRVDATAGPGAVRAAAEVLALCIAPC
ncbi:MAG: AAA family ATPase [Proteobacteria bacterium]|nr:AAA family ATPase [Pseudomonadota bacterium]